MAVRAIGGIGRPVQARETRRNPAFCERPDHAAATRRRDAVHRVGLSLRRFRHGGRRLDRHDWSGDSSGDWDSVYLGLNREWGAGWPAWRCRAAMVGRLGNPLSVGY